MRISELNLSPRTRNALGRAGIHSVVQLQRMSVADLMHLRGIGTKCADEIQTCLKLVGEEKLPERKPALSMYDLGRRDGVAVMRTAVIRELLAMAGDASGAQSVALQDASRVIRKLEVL